MMLNLTDVLLDDQRIETEVPIESDRLDFSFGSFPIIRKTPVLLVIQKKDPRHLVIEGKAEIETEIPCDVDIKVKRKDVFDLVLKYSFTSDATNKKYGPYEDTLTVRIVDDHIYENGILFDDVDFSILNNDDEGLAFTTVESNIEGLR